MRYKYGGEGGIRTLDTVLSVYPLSRRAPSAVSATSPREMTLYCVVSWILLAILSVPVNRFFDFIVFTGQSKIPGSSTMME